MSQVLFETVVFSIPEAIVIVLLVSSILDRTFKWGQLVAMGVIFGSTSHLIRQVTGSYILNIVISSLVLIGIIKLFGPHDIFEASIAGLMSISLYLAIEFVNVKTIQVFTGIDPIRMEQNIFLRTLWFLPQILAAAGLAMAIRYFVFRQSPKVSCKKD